MRKKSYRLLPVLVLLFSLSLFAAWNKPENKVSKSNIRPFHQDYGFCVNAEQFEQVVKMAFLREKKSLDEVAKRFNLASEDSFIGAICPHDDYAYAAQVYLHVMPYLKARTIVIFGVAHKAKNYSLSDRLVFCDYDKWATPLGDVPVSDIRDELIKILSSGDYIVHREFMYQEHSIEALVSWLKYYNPSVEIVPVAVPYMNWRKIDSLSERFSSALVRISQRRKLKLGKDIAILISNDASHYGDQGWRGKNYAPFGSDIKGYLMGTTRDIRMANEHLSGILTLEQLRLLLYKLVDENDPYRYKITWCGRFSVPLGLSVLYKLVNEMKKTVPQGFLLRYDTSVGLGLLDDVEPPLETTAPSNLHHWVGYLAVGYR